MSQNNNNNNNKDEFKYELCVAVPPKAYQKMMKECKRKGHTFAIDKFGKRTLVKLYGDEMREVENGQPARVVKELTKEQQEAILVML